LEIAVPVGTLVFEKNPDTGEVTRSRISPPRDSAFSSRVVGAADAGTPDSFRRPTAHLDAPNRAKPAKIAPSVSELKLIAERVWSAFPTQASRR
jgi:hypothetical protein